MQYLLLIHGNAEGPIEPDEWASFLESARAGGLFRGGSELGSRSVLGNDAGASPPASLAGFMRFDADDREALLELLQSHPVVAHGGTVELFELPES